MRRARPDRRATRLHRGRPHRESAADDPPAQLLHHPPGRL
jgi:hypothetical protein